MFTACIWGDQQIPYHDNRAIEVALQVFEEVKPHTLVFNGDWGDWRAISRYPIYNKDPRLISETRDELFRQRELLATALKRIKPKAAKWNDGNHEWRVMRSFEKIPQAMQMLGIAEVGEALGIPALLQLDKLKVKYSGPYPHGCWLHDGLEPDKNVWVEHGYSVRKKAGYTASNLMDDRMANVVVNHCEKLAGPLWKRALGRDYFAIENGNLSKIAEPDLGEGIYGGVPHSVPQYMNHRQGFSVLHYEQGHWWPFTVKIRDGRCVYGGKLYKA